jgi:hypothetical protein
MPDLMMSGARGLGMPSSVSSPAVGIWRVTKPR